MAQRRADLERQIRAAIHSDPRMALTDPEQVRSRMKLLRERAGLKQYEVAAGINEAPRTFQSWENAEVETDKANYEKVARFYSRKLKEKISANWILFGQEVPPAVVAPAPSMNGTTLSADDSERLKRIEEKLDELLKRETAPREPDREAGEDRGSDLRELGREREDQEPSQQARGRKRTGRQARRS